MIKPLMACKTTDERDHKSSRMEEDAWSKFREKDDIQTKEGGLDGHSWRNKCKMGGVYEK